MKNHQILFEKSKTKNGIVTTHIYFLKYNGFIGYCTTTEDINPIEVKRLFL